MAIFGIGLVVIGASGSFFGGLIKAAVSRQREFLADASAVQYTRNPAGIAGALKRIGVDTDNHFLDNPAATQISHALFSEGVKLKFNALFATHPPLEKRIEALDPEWSGEFSTTTSTQVPDVSPLMAAGFAVSRAGTANKEDINQAKNVLQEIPAEYQRTAREALGASAILCVLMLRQDLESTLSGVSVIEQRLAVISPTLAAEATRLFHIQAMIEPAHRLALISLCLGTLRQLTVQQYKQIRAVWSKLIETDPRPDLHSWLIFQLASNHLDRMLDFNAQVHLSVQTSLSDQQKNLSVFLSVLTFSGGLSGVDAELAFNSAANALHTKGLELIPADQLTLSSFQSSATQLKSLTYADKRQLLDAMLLCVYHDNGVTVTENELMRTTSEILGCPLPAKF
jgi:hypothetical protein